MPVCPTGAGYKRQEDALMPEWETRPANQYLPRRITPAQGDAEPSA